MQHDIENSDKAIKDRGYIRPRVRVKQKGDYQILEIFWLRMRSAATKTNPRRMYSEYIKKGSGHKYSISAFRGAQEWEKKMIRETEAILALVREQANALAQVEKRLKWIDKRNQKLKALINRHHEQEPIS